MSGFDMAHLHNTNIAVHGINTAVINVIAKILGVE